MLTRKFTAAAAQMRSGDDLAENLATCRALAAQASARGAALLVLPENFAFLGRSERDKLAVAEVLDPARPGPILSALVDIARAHGLWVVAGGMPERPVGREPDGGEGWRPYNTCPVVSPEGELCAAYRKIHLFDVDIPGRAVIRESDTTAPGREPLVVDTALARIGLSICYDLRFPELYRDLVARRGAELVVVPAAFTAHTGAAHWHVLLRARAIENQCYVIAAAQSGAHNERRESYGHTLIVDPWGAITAELAEGVGVVVADIDPEHLARTRRQMPCLSHRVLP